MTPVGTPYFFYGLSAVAIASALGVILRKNPVHCAISLIVTLLSLAGLYLMLYAPFVAGVQIILYVGGIVVLFLFVIMLINIERSSREYRFNKQWLVAVAAAAVLGALFVGAYVRGESLFPMSFRQFPEQLNTQLVGHMLYVDYLLPFEIASLLLLVAIVGAVVMAKKRI